MREAIDQLLEGRRRRGADRRRVIGAVASLVGHLVVTLGVVLAPALAARAREPIEFVEVQIVPLQALGLPEPAPPPRRPERQEPRPAPAVVPEKPAPQPPQTRRETAAPAEPERPRDSGREEADDRSGAAPSDRAQRRGSPFGSPLATSPFGTAVAGFDNPDFVYGYYVDQMLAMIGSNWVRPPVDSEVEMTIHFRIQKDGSLTEIEIIAPSGFDSFDLAGLRAVRLASPLPPLPTSFPHSSLGVRLIIR
jgi:TonB family protein